MKKLRDIAEALGRNTKPTVRTKHYPLRMKTGKPRGTDYDEEQRIKKQIRDAQDKEDKNMRETLEIIESKLKNWQIDQAEKRGVPEVEITNDDLKRWWLEGLRNKLRVSDKAREILPYKELRKMSDEKDETRRKIDALKEAKKWRPGMSSRELKALKAAAKAAPPKKKEKPKPVAKAASAPRVDDKHPLEDILKNENKDVRARLMQVHPAERANAQRYIQKHGMAAFMKNADQFRSK